MSPATTPPPKTWGRSKISATDLNREVRDQIRDLQRRILDLQGGGGGAFYPTGTIIGWTGATIPAGWYLCDGSIRSSIVDPGLAAAIGVAYNTGGETPTEFRLPKLNDALPRGGTGTSGTGAPKSVGVGGGQNTVTWNHAMSFNVVSATNSSGSHTHNVNFSFHNTGSGTEHNYNSHSHNWNNTANAGDHGHTAWASGGAHDHGGTNAFGGNVSRPAGNLTTPLAHNHGISANTAGTNGGGHNHNWTGYDAVSNNQTGLPYEPNTNNFKGSGSLNTGVHNANGTDQHSHDTSHDHSFTTPHPVIDLVPPSISVNYLIRR